MGSKLQALLAQARIATWEWDVEDDRGSVCRTLPTLFGLRSGDPIDDLPPALRWLHSADSAGYRTAFEAALTQGAGGHWHSEFRIVQPHGGAVVWLEERAHVGRDTSTGHRCISGLLWDITPRKQLEQKLVSSEEQFRTLFEAANVGMAQADPDSRRLLRVNDCLAGMLGYETEALIGRPILDLTYPDDQVENRRRLEKILRGEADRWTFEMRLRHQNGQMIWVSVNATVLRLPDARAARLNAVLIDVTRRREADEQRRRSEHRLRKALEIQTVGVIFFRTNGAITYCNPAFLAMSGYDEVDVAAGRVRWDVMTPPEWVPASYKAIEEFVTVGRTVPYEKQYIRKDGSRWWALFAASRLDEELGIEFIVDITAMKEAQHALREADRRKDQFLATLAHELRNPLAPLSNGLELLLRSPPADPGEMREWHEMMLRQVEHMVHLVDDLLDIQRITHDRITLRREAVDLRQVCRDGVEESLPLIQRADHRLHLALPDTPLLVDGDRVRLAQVVTNLLNNAAKFTPNGGSLHLSLQAEGDAAVLGVRDNGCGIAAQALPTIFEMYAQAAPPANGCEPGLGIGLALAKQLVRLHGGSIEAHSDGPSRGSEFVVRLPLTDPLALPQSRGSAATPAPQGLHVIVADDNQEAADSLAALLRLIGADVRVCYGADGVLETLEQGFPADAAVIDLGMPDMDGYELARRLRAGSGTPDLLLVALSGWGQEADKVSSATAGFQHHLVKPLRFEQLESILAQARH
ncbi:PAS domain S-box protein [Caldimonas brevitalea]|uniref:histidine kinase n=1 Tax=Caldimonas brevitalea TaxID=413882 RepID=A0A0G3BUM8_9BURK|nr:PAS domain S-box protein [Caldimonas brevitalea]AKJ31071.1 chemotaxis protein methyltransferase CheR [Caldimonas brevitalea]